MAAALALGCGHRHIDEKRRALLTDQRNDTGQPGRFYASLSRQDPHYLGYSAQPGAVIFELGFNLDELTGGHFMTTFAVDKDGGLYSLSGQQDFSGKAVCRQPPVVQALTDCREMDLSFDFKIDRGPHHDPRPVHFTAHMKVLGDYSLSGQVGDGPIAVWAQGRAEVFTYSYLDKTMREERLLFRKINEAGPAFSEPRPIISRYHEENSTPVTFTVRAPLPLMSPNGQPIYIKHVAVVTQGEATINSLPDALKIMYVPLEKPPEATELFIKLSLKKNEEKK